VRGWRGRSTVGGEGVVATYQPVATVWLEGCWGAGKKWSETRFLNLTHPELRLHSVATARSARPYIACMLRSVLRPAFALFPAHTVLSEPIYSAVTDPLRKTSLRRKGLNAGLRRNGISRKFHPCVALISLTHSLTHFVIVIFLENTPYPATLSLVQLLRTVVVLAYLAKGVSWTSPPLALLPCVAPLTALPSKGSGDTSGQGVWEGTGDAGE